MRHANWSGCYQRLCKVTATARGLDTAKCEQLVTTCHILQRMLVCACVCVCVCVVCPALLYEAACSLYKPENHMLCDEMSAVLLSRKKMSN